MRVDARLTQYDGESVAQARPHAAQLLAVLRRKFTQHALSAAPDVHGDLASVGRVPPALDQTRGFELVDEPDGRVRLDAQTLGQGADGRAPARGQALAGEQELMVLGFEPRRPCGPFAEL